MERVGGCVFDVLVTLLAALPMLTRGRTRTGLILSGATTTFRGTNKMGTSFDMRTFGGKRSMKATAKAVRLGKRGFFLGATRAIS